MARQQRLVGPKTNWVHFSGNRPALVPAGTDDSTGDVVIYDNAMVMTETAGKSGQLNVGTLVRVGEGWRLVDLPVGLVEGQANAEGGSLFFASYGTRAEDVEVAAEEAASPEVQKLVANLDKLEAETAKDTPSRTAAEWDSLHDRRVALLQELARLAKTEEERSVWLKQLADTVSAAVQTGKYTQGVQKLGELFAQLESKSELAGYVKFRQMSAVYAVNLQKPDMDFAKLQEQWLQQLEEFVSEYPSTPDASDALLQLAIAQEFAGKDEDAQKWYKQIVEIGGDTVLAKKAQGALRRLDSVGKPLELRGRLADGEASIWPPPARAASCWCNTGPRGANRARRT